MQMQYFQDDWLETPWQAFKFISLKQLHSEEEFIYGIHVGNPKSSQITVPSDFPDPIFPPGVMLYEGCWGLSTSVVFHIWVGNEDWGRLFF